MATGPQLLCRWFPRRVHRPVKPGICLVYAGGTQTGPGGQRMVMACRTNIESRGVSLKGNCFLSPL